MIAAKTYWNYYRNDLQNWYCHELHKQDFLVQSDKGEIEKWWCVQRCCDLGSCTKVLQVSGCQAGIRNQYRTHWLWHDAVPAEQVRDADKRTAAASRCYRFLTRAHSHVQLSGRHCIGFRCGTSLTGLCQICFFFGLWNAHSRVPQQNA